MYEFAEPFEGGQAQVGRDGLTGTVNKTGKEVIEVIYDDVLGFSEGLATVERGGKAGVVDRSGKLVIKMEYDEVGEFSGGLAYAEKEAKSDSNCRSDTASEKRTSASRRRSTSLARCARSCSSVCALSKGSTLPSSKQGKWLFNTSAYAMQIFLHSATAFSLPPGAAFP